MKVLLLNLARVLARLGLWTLAVAFLVHSGPLDSLPPDGRKRLLYAMLMSSKSRLTRSAFRTLVRKNLDRSAATNFTLAVMAERLQRPGLAIRIYRRTLKLPADSHEHALASTTAEFLSRLASKRLQQSLAALVASLPLESDQNVVLITAGKNYLDLFHLWHEQAKQHLGDRIIAIALDAITAQALVEALPDSLLDLSSWFVNAPAGTLHERSRNTLWIIRVLLLRELVQRGHRVISIDLDAMPVGAVNAMLLSLPSADIIVQRDYSIPVEVARRHGFVLCCGFMVLNPTTSTKAFLDSFAERTAWELDDQLALNHIIAEAGIAHRMAAANAFTFESAGVRWLCPDSSLVSRDLATGSVVRHFHQEGQSIAEIRHALRHAP